LSQIGARTTGGVVKITVSDGGSGYSSPPAVTISGGGGTGVSAVAHMAGTRVESVVIVNGGTGYTGHPAVTIAAPTGGTAASASAFAYFGALRPISFFKGRYQDMYGVDGMGRGFRWNGDDATVEKLGLEKPAVGPTMTVATTGQAGYLDAVQIVNAGAGYAGIPAVTITGGTPDKPATARAVIANGRVTGVIVTDRGAGYVGTPTVSFSGGIGTGASFGVGVNGKVSALRITAAGSGYTTTPTCTASSSSSVFTCNNHGLSAGSTFYFTSLTGGTGLTVGTTYYAVTVAANTFTAATTSATTAATNILSGNLTSGVVVIPGPRVEFAGAGLAGAHATVSVNSSGIIFDSLLQSAGSGATGTGVTASVVGGAGTGASLSVDMSYAVASVTAVSSGTGYYAAPVVTFRAASFDTAGRGAAVTAFVNSTGNVSGATVIYGGEYASPPTAIVLDTSASAQATITQRMGGKYKCAIRYLDDTPESQYGEIPSSISDLVEVDAGYAASGMTWSFSHYGLDDRVAAMELWRSTADQSILLFRVATIKRSDSAFTGSYVDTLSDPELQDGSRQGYAIMPVTLPNGQINARRFQTPPGHFAVACMFQDRAWYAVDVTGEKPNTLYFSEIDEPESVPEENELVVQENTPNPDKIIALVPLGGQLIAAQHSHLYSLTYVAQPVIDASVLLVAYRGILNSRCWCVIGGAAIIADSVGIYAFDGQNEEALSVPIDNYWREKIVDLTKADQFHMQADIATKTARFFYCQSGDSAPTRALCYCVATKTWWEETFPIAVTATSQSVIAGVVTPLSCLGGGTIVKPSGVSDSGAGVPYTLRTGNSALTNENSSRAISILYKPTTADSQLQVGLHYNNSPSPRPNAIASDRGNGFTTVGGSTAAVLNMNKNRSALGEANGFAQAYFSGRVDDRSSGGDRHVAIAVSGTQSADAVVLYAIQMQGAE